MAHHLNRLEEVKATRKRLKKENQNKKSLPQELVQLQAPVKPVGSSGMLGMIGPAGISLAKGLVQKFKGSFRTGAKGFAQDQTIATSYDLLNK